MIRYCDILTHPEYVVRLSNGFIYRVVARSLESETYDSQPIVRWIHGIRSEHGSLFHADMTPDEVRETDECPVPGLDIIVEARHA